MVSCRVSEAAPLHTLDLAENKSKLSFSSVSLIHIKVVKKVDLPCVRELFMRGKVVLV